MRLALATSLRPSKDRSCVGDKSQNIDSPFLEGVVYVDKFDSDW